MAVIRKLTALKNEVETDLLLAKSSCVDVDRLLEQIRTLETLINLLPTI